MDELIFGFSKMRNPKINKILMNNFYKINKDLSIF